MEEFGMNDEVTAATTESFSLAEGPVWDAVRSRLLWVDILEGEVMEGTLEGTSITITDRHCFDEMIGAVVVAEDGSLLVAAQECLVAIGTDGSRRIGPRIIPAGARRRLNDGATDPAGRFLVGTLSLEGPSSSKSEILVRLEPDGRVTQLDSDLRVSNGIAWSADGTLLYSIDTRRKLVFVRNYDASTGNIGERRIHLEITDGFPDGMAIDAADHLLVAIWGAGEVRRFAPDGRHTDTLAVPAPHTSSVAFAGDDLSTLVITSGRTRLDDIALRAAPDSGRLFVTRTDVPGAPLAPWSGSAAFM
jgi:sugar lactone lactonase YvrE